MHEPRRRTAAHPAAGTLPISPHGNTSSPKRKNYSKRSFGSPSSSSSSLLLFLLVVICVSVLAGGGLLFSSSHPTDQHRNQQQDKTKLQSKNDPKSLKESAAVDTSSSPDSPPDWKEGGNLLAMLYPPGLIGGYRNQVIRFLAFCLYALNHNIPYLLLPSLMWVTQVREESGSSDGDNDKKEVWVPIPFDLLFDVDHWNAHANDKLPILIDYDESYDYDCWSTVSASDIPTTNITSLAREVLKHGVLTPIANRSVAVVTRQEIINPRSVDFSDEVQHCRKPRVYGGGRGAGKLWNDYLQFQNQKSKNKTEHGNVDAALLQALQPNRRWRDLAMSCVERHVHHKEAPYVALHARVELEMMDHSCGKNMEKNLTKIFGMIADLIANEELDDDAQGVFVAVSRSGMELNEGRWYERFKAYADENIRTLNSLVGHGDGEEGIGLGEAHLPVFECGEKLMDQYYQEHPDSIDYGSVLQSIVNFYIATASTAFVGVRGSSYSTDIWTTRYHQGKGHSNFEYTPDGIIAMENDGLPPPHKNCGRKRKPA